MPWAKLTTDSHTGFGSFDINRHFLDTLMLNDRTEMIEIIPGNKQDPDIVQEIRDIMRDGGLPFEEIVTESIVKYLHDEDKLGTAICTLFDVSPDVVGDIHIDIPPDAPVVITFKVYPALLRRES